MNEQLFTGKAEYYEKSRPMVAKDAIDYLCSIVPPDAVFADIGAGTGKFTSLIAERGYFVYAVEPNEAMYSVLYDKLKKISNVNIIFSSAENTKIPSHSVDAVVAVTALHWFNLDMFRAECLRILKPNGLVIAIYNSRREELRNNIGNSSKNATQIFFNAKYQIVEFPNTKYYSYDEFVAYHLSHTTAPKPEDDAYKQYLKELDLTFKKYNIAGRYRFDFVSVLYFDREFVSNNLSGN